MPPALFHHTRVLNDTSYLSRDEAEKTITKNLDDKRAAGQLTDREQAALTGRRPGSKEDGAEKEMGGASTQSVPQTAANRDEFKLIAQHHFCCT